MWKRLLFFLLTFSPVIAFMVFMMAIYYKNPVDPTCASFSTRKDAQRYYEAHPLERQLDRDHDGRACELLP